MPVKILVIDDSALMRQVLTGILEAEPGLAVIGTAQDGLDALEKAERLKPDVITLDIEMPYMDGLEFLRRLMSQNPVPVVMVSSYTIAGAEPTLRAFELGAVDFVTKLSATEPEQIIDPAELVQKVKIAATVKVSKLKSLPTFKAAASKKAPSGPVRKLKSLEVLAIGTSTGGPRALHELLPAFPEDFPLGVIIAQHMPAGFTRVFADRLNQGCRLEVVEAQPGDEIEPGRILIAPSGKQTRVVRERNKLRVEVVEKSNLIYKPSADFLFKSLVTACQGRVLGVVLTGMGADGATGLKELRQQGARTIAEAEESCVVFGMPRVAIELGAAEFVASLSQIYPRIKQILEESN